MCDKIMTACREELIARDVTSLSARMDGFNKQTVDPCLSRKAASRFLRYNLCAIRFLRIVLRNVLYSRINVADTRYSLTGFCFYYKLTSSRVGGRLAVTSET